MTKASEDKGSPEGGVPLLASSNTRFYWIFLKFIIGVLEVLEAWSALEPSDNALHASSHTC